MGKSTSEWQAEFIATCQPHVAEPIVAIGMFQPKNQTVGVLLSLVSPLAGMFARRSGRKAAGGLPPLALYALTDRALHVLEVKPRGRQWKVKKVAAVLDRSTLSATSTDGTTTRQLHLTTAAGGSHELQNLKMMERGLNDQIVAMLTAQGGVERRA